MNREEPIEICRIPVGTMILAICYVIQRIQELWVNILFFEPERFMTVDITSWSVYSFCPCGAGLWHHIVNNSPQIKIKSLNRRDICKFRLDLAFGHMVAIQPRITQQPAHGVHIRHARRNVN